ncbi:hypothetical protein [Marinobacterium jannaschii]|uniref:hypothetical protein n=1 Tax=Marinobacterium jannaschii TaxID=64970 RepID=UPI0004841E2C|nr:hypothetical protein [Marinobacterium jannaschii]
MEINGIDKHSAHCIWQIWLAMTTVYPKGDLRRLLMILAAIDQLSHPSARSIAAHVQLPVSTVQSQLKKLVSGEIPKLVITCSSGIYTIDSYGDVICREGLIAFYNEAMNG